MPASAPRKRPSPSPLPRGKRRSTASPNDRTEKNGRPTAAALAVWLLLLVLPALAIHHLADSFDIRFTGGALVLISVITWSLYRKDKNNAQSGRWRIPESTLHLAELAGGWIAAYLAQRIIRHKVAKTSYQITFWVIVLLHQYAAFDCVNDWKYFRSLVALLGDQF